MSDTPGGVGPGGAGDGIVDLSTRQGHPAEESLAGYADEMLPAAEMERVERHLGGCAECRRAVDELRRGLAALTFAPEPPPDLLQHARARRWALDRAGEFASSGAEEAEPLGEVVGRGEEEDEELSDDDGPHAPDGESDRT